MPLIDMTTSDTDTIMKALRQARQITSDCGQDCDNVVFTAYLQLYSAAVNILWAYRKQFDNVVLRIMGMYILMSALGL